MDLTVPGSAAWVCLVRRWVADALTVAGHREVDGARLVASELVGNAVLHTGSGRPGGLVRVKVFEVTAVTARVEVIDEGAATVPLRARSLTAPPPTPARTRPRPAHPRTGSGLAPTRTPTFRLEERPVRATAPTPAGRAQPAQREGNVPRRGRGADGMGCSAPTITRIEAALVGARISDVTMLLDIYEVPAHTREVLLQLARDARKRGWWDKLSDAIPEYFQGYVGLEEDTSSIFGYETEYVPGLFQTEP
ncbi:ATP-binding protein [Nonomuraea sp. C10]|uniref:ATP-binding protein n=1 Tax=Nonomuraea sp. C10 TaxID=2600577 RepID=UPI0021C4695F|nr:ATP-binding protein [Nonomuraea sp. C10]